MSAAPIADLSARRSDQDKHHAAARGVFERIAPTYDLLNRMLAFGVAPGFAELLISREWAIEAGENERITHTVTDLTGQKPRTVEAYLHANRGVFLP